MQENFENNNFSEEEANMAFDAETLENENQQSFFTIDEDTSYRFKKGDVYPVVVSSYKQNIKREKTNLVYLKNQD